MHVKSLTEKAENGVEEIEATLGGGEQAQREGRAPDCGSFFAAVTSVKHELEPDKHGTEWGAARGHRPAAERNAGEETWLAELPSGRVDSEKDIATKAEAMEGERGATVLNGRRWIRSLTGLCGRANETIADLETTKSGMEARLGAPGGKSVVAEERMVADGSKFAEQEWELPRLSGERSSAQSMVRREGLAVAADTGAVELHGWGIAGKFTKYGGPTGHCQREIIFS